MVCVYCWPKWLPMDVMHVYTHYYTKHSYYNKQSWYDPCNHLWIYGHKQPSQSGYALGLWWFMDHKSLPTKAVITCVTILIIVCLSYIQRWSVLIFRLPRKAGWYSLETCLDLKLFTGAMKDLLWMGTEVVYAEQMGSGVEGNQLAWPHQILLHVRNHVVPFPGLNFSYTCISQWLNFTDNFYGKYQVATASCLAH